ncbi:hypothetical protein Tco_0515320, partial [Tanacetum coccineum]
AVHSGLGITYCQGDGFEAYWVGGLREIVNKGDLSRGQALEKVTATDLFYLRSMDKGTAVNVPYLLAQYLFRHADRKKRGARMIDMDELVATAGALEDDEGAHVELEGVQADLAPIQAPQPPLVVAQFRTMPQRMARLEEEVHGLRKSLDEQREVMDPMARHFLGLPCGQLV